MKVTNTSKALQGVHTATGVAYLKPGESKDLPLTEKHAERAARLGFIELDGDPVEDTKKPAPTSGGKDGVYIPANELNAMRNEFEGRATEIARLKGLIDERDAEIAKLKGDEPDREDLKKQAKELGIEHAPNIPSAKLKELIDAKLAS